MSIGNWAITHGSGHASYTHGYRAGGHGGPQIDNIEKWSFATDSDSVFVANMNRGIDTGQRGASSGTHGYMMGGHGPSQTEIDKFSFETDSNSVDFGDLFHGEAYASGTSSTTHGYMAGGGHPQIDTIQKIDFAGSGGSTNVGNIGTGGGRAYLGGFQD